MIVDLEAGDFRFTDDYFRVVLGLFGLIVAKGSGSGQSSWVDPKRSNNLPIVSVRSLSHCSGLINFASSFENSLLLLGVGGLVIFCDLVAFVELF